MRKRCLCQILRDLDDADVCLIRSRGLERIDGLFHEIDVGVGDPAAARALGDCVGMTRLVLPAGLIGGGFHRANLHADGAFGRSDGIVGPKTTNRDWNGCNSPVSLRVVETLARLLEIAFRRTHCATRALVPISSAENMMRSLPEECADYVDAALRHKVGPFMPFR